MKKCILLITFILTTIGCFAQNYYEVPYAGTRSRLTKLTTAEEDVFVKENSVRRIYDVPDYDRLKRGEKVHSGFFTEEEGEILGTLDIYAELAHVYKEEIPDEKGNVKLTVYRAMYDFMETTKLNLTPNDRTERKCLGQAIYVPSNGKYLMYDKHIYFGNQRYKYLDMSMGVESNNVQFRICGENVFAFYTRLTFMWHTHGYGEEASYSTSGFTKNAIYRTKIPDIMDKTQVCEVDVDFPLIDKDNPFRYSAQNAYDGDPATSYVEDTENDLFGIRFDFTKHGQEYEFKKTTGFKIINGYASSKDLYMKNNRIKKISFGSQKNPTFYNFQDKILDYQDVNFEYSLYALTITCLEVFIRKQVFGHLFVRSEHKI